jgi:hypothetical protein
LVVEIRGIGTTIFAGKKRRTQGSRRRLLHPTPQELDHQHLSARREQHMWFHVLKLRSRPSSRVYRFMKNLLPCSQAPIYLWPKIHPISSILTLFFFCSMMLFDGNTVCFCPLPATKQPSNFHPR